MNASAPNIRLVPSPSKILAPVDFSEPSIEAMHTAAFLTQRFGATLGVLHVTRQNRRDSHSVAEQVGLSFDTRREGRVNLTQLLERELPQTMQPTRIVADGVPFEEICRTAESWKAGLIVLSTRGHSGFKQVLIGSTAERVVRWAPCSVMVVRQHGKPVAGQRVEMKACRSILVAIDFSRTSIQALRQAVSLAKEFDASLTLLHVVESIRTELLVDTSQVQRELRRAAQLHLRALLNRTRRAWAKTYSELRSGSPVNVINDSVTRCGADLLVIGTSTKSTLKDRLLGSVAERLVRLAPCSVWVVR